MTDAIKIKGGNYRVTDTQDGYFTVHDVPLVSTWKKGDHGAPYDGTKEIMQQMVNTAQSRYQEGHFCATAYKGHNPDIPITSPEFVGYVLPNRVGKYQMETGEKDTIFGDVKMSAEKFADARAGKLPYVSVEIPWARKRIRGLSFQDTLPPQYEYPIFTVQEPTLDATAKFTAVKEDVAQFKEDDHMDDKIEKAVAKYMGDHIGKYVNDYMDKNMKKHTSDGGKPNAKPAEPTDNKGGKMAVDPEFAAKFTAQTAEVAELKAKFAAQENEKKASGLVAKAESELSRKVISQDLMEQIGLFAAEAVTKEDGEKWFDKFVGTLKPSLRDKPPRDMGEFMADGNAVRPDAQDPTVAKFAQEGPDVLEQVAKFAGQYRALKTQLGDRMESTEEHFVKNELMVWKAKRNGTLTETRR